MPELSMQGWQVASVWERTMFAKSVCEWVWRSIDQSEMSEMGKGVLLLAVPVGDAHVGCACGGMEAAPPPRLIVGRWDEMAL